MFIKIVITLKTCTFQNKSKYYTQKTLNIQILGKNTDWKNTNMKTKVLENYQNYIAEVSPIASNDAKQNQLAHHFASKTS